MSKVFHSLDERNVLHAMTMDATQLLLEGMMALGEFQGGYQAEIDGVVECVIVRRVTQMEFADWSAKRATAEERGGGSFVPTLT